VTLMNVLVTGGSGRAGRHVVEDLRSAGHEVLNVDVVHDGSAFGLCLLADLKNSGEVFEVMNGRDAIVHFAAIPSSGIHPESTTFTNNTISTYNVFAMARDLGISRVVWASSETVYGFPFEESAPERLPVEENLTPRPRSDYALSKVVAEQLAEHMGGAETSFVGLRISKIVHQDGYSLFPSYWSDSKLRRRNLWAYVDVRDVSAAVSLSLTCDLRGSEVFNIGAGDTVMNVPTEELVATEFPDVEYRSDGSATEPLFSIRHAQASLAYEPNHSWRDEL
jgi:nucleoside-diphosphate-sugar epimerase